MHAGPLQQRGDLAVHEVQLDQRRAAHAVDASRSSADPAKSRSARIGSTSCAAMSFAGGERLAMAARLAVDADPDLHLVVGQLEGRPARRRHGAARQRHAHRCGPAPFTGAARSATAARSRPSSAAAPDDLLQQHRERRRRGARRCRACPAPRRRRRSTTERTSMPSVGRELGGHLEVHHVAGVVLHDVQHARRRRRSACVAASIWSGRRRGEHLARAGRVEHPGADEPAVQRLVPGSAAGDQRRPCPAPWASPRRITRFSRSTDSSGCASASPAATRRARPPGR